MCSKCTEVTLQMFSRYIADILRIDFDILKFIVSYEAWGNKTKEIYYSSLNLQMISFVLFP